MRKTLPLAFLLVAAALYGCDSSEEPPVRFDGRYRAIGPWPTTWGTPAGYTFDLELTNDADGAVSGSGTLVFISERSGPQPPRALDVSGTTAGAGIAMRMVSDGYRDLPFQGSVSQDGEVIDGAISTTGIGDVSITVPVTFKRVP